ncbi:hypothetical protein [Dictyobacter aurantiacus]|uniref:Uncharacterized protein n=1 Tax=Dictyobacter aurantiacus TaxID=1936993 RepID=A0A401ZJ71_9CHLR|nr:hypothetical protein [Dictyobacter aurantiacus]GCE06878.1 hypothetical protein KDAU_42070 [Dictyobacter aurantiacus]
MQDRHAPQMDAMLDVVATQPGATTTELREQVRAYAERLSLDASAPAQDVPSDLVAYVRKVALHAYKVQDEDILTLWQAGYSQDALFEITLSVAMGTARARLARGLQALKEATE